MEQFRYLDHTADLKFQAYGRTLEEAFSNAVYAMMGFLLPDEEVKTAMEKELRIRAPRRDTLLYSFLEEILFLMETKHFLPGKILKLQIKGGNEWTLRATIAGDSYEEYETKGDIKAITYSDMLIEEQKERWMVQVVVDI
jgi:SHS2 domain-containing protein